MKRFGFCCGLVFYFPALFAQIEGPRNGGTFTTAPLAGSSQTWVNPGNVAASDNVYANFANLAGPVGTHTDFLVVTNFGFAIPSGSTINGIVVEIERTDPNFRTSDYAMRIVKGGVISAIDRSVGAAYLTESYQTYGTAGDYWGETSWSAEEINDPGFGIAMAAQRIVSSGITAGRIDHVRITVFYDFIVTPLRLISFTGAKKDNLAQLTWITDAEINMDRYEIERSADGRNFTTIAVVKSINQPSRSTYTYMDENPLNGISYYRLKMLGTAARDISYSNIIVMDFNNNNRSFLYPNPLRQGENLFINNSSGQQFNIRFYTISGQKTADLIINSTSMPLNNLSKGILLYKIVDKNKNVVSTGKLVVN